MGWLLDGMKHGFLAVLVGLAAATPAGAQVGGARSGIILFDGVNYTGEQRDFPNAVTDLDTYRFNDRARSVVIDDRAWEICEDKDFEGRCVRLDRDAPNLAAVGMTQRISSARPLEAPAASPGALRLYGEQGLRGRPLRLIAAASNLQAQSFNDEAQSLSAERPWQVCENPNYGGRCRVVNGDVADLRAIGLRGAISSARPHNPQPASAAPAARAGNLRGRTAAFYATTTTRACPRSRSNEDCHQDTADAFCRRNGYREAGYYSIDRRQSGPPRLGDVLCLR